MPIHYIEDEHPSHARQIRKNVGNKVCKAYYKLDQKLKVKFIRFQQAICKS